ncbi:TRAP transporter large permease subunit [Ramlibacter sp.]|uniref:TRAP transporter large permease subunit n=1 Tax=Ramlibacter sp. TaxID=1917967 RepID=UPI0035B02E58
MEETKVVVGDVELAGAADLSRATPAARGVAGAARGLFGLAGIGVLFLVCATVYDVFARYFFNAPTAWATEVSTYVLIAIIFFGAAPVHLRDGNVRVDMLLNVLRGRARERLLMMAAWVGFVFVFITGWQAALMAVSDYVNGARIFSLILTPTWMPKAPIAVGLFVLAAAMLVEVERLAGPIAAWRRWTPYALVGVLCVVLLAMGRQPPVIGDTRFDWGSLLVLLTVFAASAASGGAVVLAGVVLLTVGGFAATYFGQMLGLGWVSTAMGLGILVALAAGIRIAFALGFVGLVSVYFMTPVPFPLTLGDRTWAAVNSFSLTAVPMFVLMGALLVRSGLSNELFTVMTRLLGRLPGGLAHAATAGCGLFSAVSGSSVATAATIGGIACPEMTKRGYKPALSFGAVAAGGTLGILIPPSVPMIIYATTVGVPVVALFIAGIVPGLVMLLSFMLVILIWCTIDPSAAPKVDPRQVGTISRRSYVDTGLLLGLILLVIATLYMGIATPSETGAVGAFLAVVVCALRGRMSRETFVNSISETVVVTSFIFLIIAGSNVLTFGFDYLKMSQVLMDAALSAELNRWTVMFIVVCVYVALGTFLDEISMLLMTLPVVFPLIVKLGFDPVWFGIILVIMCTTGLITPPVGMNLFVLQGINRDVSLKTIAYGALPFLFAMLANVLLLCFFPEIALWLTTHLD